MEEIKSTLQPVDVAKVLNIPKEVFIKLPVYKQIYLLRKVHEVFSKYNEEE